MDKEGREDEIGGKFAPIYQETQAEEASAKDDKASRKNGKNNCIKVKVNGKWWAQEKLNNKQNSVMKKKDACIDVIHKYLQKIDD